MVASRQKNKREHRFAIDNLSAYLDGELTAREDARIKEHLRHCASCRQDAATLRATAQLLRQAPRQPLPRSFTLSPDAINQQRSYQRWSLAQTWLRSASAVVSVLLVVLLSGDVILSQGWFSPRMAKSAPVMSQPTAVMEAAVERVVEEAVEMEAPVVAESKAQVAPMTKRAGPMITSVRPLDDTDTGSQATARVEEQPEAAPVAKMMPQEVASSESDSEQPTDAPMAAASDVRAVAAPAMPRTSSAPGSAVGGGAAPQAAEAYAAPGGVLQAESMEEPVRVIPTQVATPAAVAAMENLQAPTNLPDKGTQDGAQIAQDQAVPMIDSQPNTAAPAAKGDRQIPTAVPTTALLSSEQQGNWSVLRSAALIAFGTLLMLLAGLVLARQRVKG